ncbi:bidirectional sugar transporter SWEET6b-like [Andrographis paniculata]|uniref:bidirectional sugar transporter SWEET6b-like n=1 Tax=Andrographis paniculata TaxID=175694 RepID=UPI0021E8B985|nr:bidirectional sugar transporter SWEET6b-like [Andrographis paniculata]
MLQGQDLARTIVGIVGNVISGLLFLSPCPTFWRILKKKDSEQFHPYPYIACVMNCLFWIFYGLPIVHPDSTLVITINGAGLFLELCYLLIFFIYTNKKNRGIIILFLLAEFLLLGIVAVITLLCFHTHTRRSMFVGIICVVFGIIMYGSPLSILRRVLKTKSAEYLPGWLCLAGFTNGTVWFAYANLKSFDPYIATANGIGALLGFIQLSVLAYYTWIYPKFHKTQIDVKPGAAAAAAEVQLQNTAGNRPQV